MNSAPSNSREATERVRGMALEAGAYRCGFAAADRVHDDPLDAWLAAGRHAEMAWMERNGHLRSDPRQLLPGARTVIACAFPYHCEGRSEFFAEYAQGLDYHDVLRERLRPVVDAIESEFGAGSRVCIDSAPVRERYWAVRAGLGVCGLNGQLIIPGAGSRFFLAEIITTADFVADEPATGSCLECGACLRACPGGALTGDGGVDCRRCLSYLTVEHRGEYPAEAPRPASLVGCDVCQRVCPMNAVEAPEGLPEFATRPGVAGLTPADVAAMSHQEYLEAFRGTPVRHIPYTRLQALAQKVIKK